MDGWMMTLSVVEYSRVLRCTGLSIYCIGVLLPSGVFIKCMRHTKLHSHVFVCSLGFIFSWSYCYTVWSAIGISLLSVRLSVCLWGCALWLSGLMYGAKSCSNVLLASMFLFVPFWHFCCRMYRLATKCTTKIESRKHLCILAYMHYLLFTRLT